MVITVGILININSTKTIYILVNNYIIIPTIIQCLTNYLANNL